MGSSTLSLGMSFGLMNYNANYLRTNPFDLGDPLTQQIISAFLPTAGVGAFWSGERWYMGLSTPNLSPGVGPSSLDSGRQPLG
jgi:hypothetical protein